LLLAGAKLRFTFSAKLQAHLESLFPEVSLAKPRGKDLTSSCCAASGPTGFQHSNFFYEAFASENFMKKIIKVRLQFCKKA